MNQFIQVTKIEYNDEEREFEESTLYVNVDAIAYVNSKVIHLTSGETILCKEQFNDIVRLINHP